ncbi:hypothetical protein [Nitrosomonas sp.]|uniref:hypothetical protein n=1 Tax=Nitrosomonas sp. TaxID=42353 RepID=UPI0025F71F2F|nr:hypothetical protein [Nitrosomonas sp.]
MPPLQTGKNLYPADHTGSPVIPAKAGIHRHTAIRDINSIREWFLACARMTVSRCNFCRHTVTIATTPKLLQPP